MSDTVEFQVYDLTNSENPGFQPGFYYSIPTGEEVEGDPIPLAGPYETREAAREAAVTFIKDALAEHEGDDTLEEEVDFVGDLPVDEDLEPNALMVEDEEISEETLPLVMFKTPAEPLAESEVGVLPLSHDDKELA